MRIVISNPDGIGDAVLRLPMFEALRDAGHELLLICRDHSGPLLRRLGERVRVATFCENPYLFTLWGRVDFEPGVFEAVERFGAELLVLGSYQWTILEERLARLLPAVPRIRLNGYRFEHLTHAGLGLPASERERVVEVAEYSHETVKAEALCGAILGREMVLGDPVISATPEDMEAGRACVKEAWGDGAPANLWIGCMGTIDGFYGQVKDWGAANWRAILRHMVGELESTLVLAGNEAERHSLEHLRAQSDTPERLHVVTGEAGREEDFSRLLGLTWLARGYIGRDTSAMHIAAALKKPVAAVFGGGHWPRFTPMVAPSFALTMALPCSPCAWACHMPESLCVKRVPVNMMKAAVNAIASGTANGREMTRITPAPELLQAARIKG